MLYCVEVKILSIPQVLFVLNFQGKLETHKEYRQIIEKGSRFNTDCIAGAFYSEKTKLKVKKAPELEYYSDEQLYHLIGDLFGAGLDTTMTTLKWALLYLASYPKLQDIIAEELAATPSGICFESAMKMPKTSVSNT